MLPRLSFYFMLSTSPLKLAQFCDCELPYEMNVDVMKMDQKAIAGCQSVRKQLLGPKLGSKYTFNLTVTMDSVIV